MAQVEVGGGKKAIIIFVPYRLLRSYHKIQQRLVRELEKKFRWVTVVVKARLAHCRLIEICRHCGLIAFRWYYIYI